MKTLLVIFSYLILNLWFSPASLAANPIDVYEFDTPEQEQRYHALNQEFRCPKCLNTNIAGSDSMISQDLRRAVYQLVVEKQMSDDQIREFMQTRYGDFILYNTPFNSRTLLIWALPVIIAVVILFVLLNMLRRARSTNADYSRDEIKNRVADLLDRQ